MATEADRSGVRLCTRQALRVQETLSQARDACSDATLRALLAHIGQRQGRHSQRLMTWLQPGEDAKSNAAQDPAGSVSQARTEPEPRAPVERPPDRAPAGAAGAVSRPTQGNDGITVTGLDRITPELLRITLPRPRDFHFTAGQSVKLALEGVRRSYSIVSAPHEPVLEFYIELVPGGKMSAHLQRLKVGDRMELGAPKGGLRLDTAYNQHLMVATVTGINPFVSILRDYLHRGLGGHRFHVLHGASYQTEFGYREELATMAAAHPERLTYLPTVSRPDEPANAGWTGSTGRVHTLIGDYLHQAGLNSENTLIYACGHSGLLQAVKRDYGPRGFRLRTENYG